MADKREWNNKRNTTHATQLIFLFHTLETNTLLFHLSAKHLYNIDNNDNTKQTTLHQSFAPYRRNTTQVESKQERENTLHETYDKQNAFSKENEKKS